MPEDTSSPEDYGTLSERLIKKKVPRKHKDKAWSGENEDMFVLMYGAVRGLLVGLAFIERESQMLGKPHAMEHCLLGRLCPEHGKDIGDGPGRKHNDQSGDTQPDSP